RPGLVGPGPAVVAGDVLDRCEVPVPAGGRQCIAGNQTTGLGRRGVPARAHADRLREEGRLERVPKAMHRVDTEDDRDVQPRVADREVLHGVVLVGPIKAGVAGAALRGCGDRNVASTGQDRARVVVDEYLLLTNGVGQVEATLAGTAVGRV